MEEKNLKQQSQSEGSYSNIIFGTSSDDIQQGLDNNQFIDSETPLSGGDEDQIVNEQDQNEIVNPSEETFNEEPAPKTPAKDNTPAGETKQSPTELKENVIDLDVDQNDIDKSGKISKAED